MSGQGRLDELGKGGNDFLRGIFDAWCPCHHRSAGFLFCGHPTNHPTIASGAVVFHWPRVKSGKSCGIPSSATDLRDRGVTADQRHPS